MWHPNIYPDGRVRQTLEIFICRWLLVLPGVHLNPSSAGHGSLQRPGFPCAVLLEGNTRYTHLRIKM